MFSEHVKGEVARVAMELKRKNLRPTPRRVRARLPDKTINPCTGEHMSDYTVHCIFKTRCFDEDEDDPWVYMPCLSQDFLPDGFKPKRVICANHILTHFSAGAWVHQVSIDPCSTLLPRTMARLFTFQMRLGLVQLWSSFLRPYSRVILVCIGWTKPSAPRAPSFHKDVTLLEIMQTSEA